MTLIRWRKSFGPEEPVINEGDPDAGEAWNDYEARLLEWQEDIWDDPENLVQPEPESFRADDEEGPRVDLEKEFAEHGLQVIIKLANIHLTPEKPEYPGGTWHVEGTLVCLPIYCRCCEYIRHV